MQLDSLPLWKARLALGSWPAVSAEPELKISDGNKGSSEPAGTNEHILRESHFVTKDLAKFLNSALPKI